VHAAAHAPLVVAGGARPSARPRACVECDPSRSRRSFQTLLGWTGALVARRWQIGEWKPLTCQSMVHVGLRCEQIQETITNLLGLAEEGAHQTLEFIGDAADGDVANLLVRAYTWPAARSAHPHALHLYLFRSCICCAAQHAPRTPSWAMYIAWDVVRVVVGSNPTEGRSRDTHRPRHVCFVELRRWRSVAVWHCRRRRCLRWRRSYDDTCRSSPSMPSTPSPRSPRSAPPPCPPRWRWRSPRPHWRLPLRSRCTYTPSSLPRVSRSPSPPPLASLRTHAPHTAPHYAARALTRRTARNERGSVDEGVRRGRAHTARAIVPSILLRCHKQLATSQREALPTGRRASRVVQPGCAR
jgi:hypothetical protein